MTYAGRRQKGKGFENLVGKLLGNWWQGSPFYRSHGSGSSSTLTKNTCGKILQDGDLLVSTDFPFCVECKKHEGWTLDAIVSGKCAKFKNWVKQTVNQAQKADKHPMLCFTRNHAPNYIALFYDKRKEVPVFTEIPSVLFVLDKKLVYITILDKFVEYGTAEEIKEQYLPGQKFGGTINGPVGTSI